LVNNNSTTKDNDAARLHVIASGHTPREDLGVRVRLLRQNMQMETHGLLRCFECSIMLFAVAMRRLFTPRILRIAIGLLD